MELDPAETFRQEAAELLDSLELALLDLSQRPQDSDLIDTAFRALHTIKGSGSMFGFDQVAAFTHDFETAFDLIRKGRIAPNADIVSVSLAAKDHIRTLIDDPGATDPIIGDAILDELRRYVGQPGDAIPTQSPNTDDQNTDDQNTGVQQDARQDSHAMPDMRRRQVDQPQVPGIEAADTAAASAATDQNNETPVGWTVRMQFHPDILRNGTNPLALLDDLRALGSCQVTPDLRYVPALDALDPASCLIAWDVCVTSACSQADIEDIFMFVRDEMTLALAPLNAPTNAVPLPPTDGPAQIQAQPDEQTVATLPAAGRSEPAPPAAEKGETKRRVDDSTPTVRVQAERLDELMDRVGELVIAQARLSQLANAGTDLAIKSIAEEIERLASGLRDSTMGVRMVPMGSLFGRFRRLVHDLSRDLGKPVEFVTVGEDTKLDKTMIERLADPLVHVIRNAIDHGIEGAEDRAATAKDAMGRIELSARYVGAQVLVTVSDDGAGLDAVRIRAKAEEQGLVAAGATLSDQEIYQFLFHPGFSTAKTISALSGRGVGMDVVKRTIEAMRGSIDLTTRRGHGSTVTLRLPLTLAIIDGLLIRVDQGRYIIPLSAVEECIEMREEAHRSRGRSFLNVRGNLVPFLRLRNLFACEGVPDPHQKTIIVSTGDTRVGLVVDQIIGSHQTVIKSLSKLHSDVTMFSGATILGDGTAALILDVAQLVAAGQARPDGDPWAEAA